MKCYYTGLTNNLERRIIEHAEGLKWSRKKKEALIAGDMSALSNHAKSSAKKRGDNLF